MIAGSVDPVEKTIELADKLGVSYPIAYGLEAEAISRLTGSFYEKEKRYLQPTGIIVRPDKNTACLPIVVPSSSAMCGPSVPTAVSSGPWSYQLILVGS